MIKNKIIIMIAMLLIRPGVYAVAQNERSAQPTATTNVNDNNPDDDVRQVNEQIFFRIGESGIDLSYMDNAQRIDVFINTLKRVLADPDYIVSRIVVVGMASPDGLEHINIALAGRRAKSLAKYLQLHTTVVADKIEVVNGGVNWAGLRMMIEESKDMPHRDAMLRLIDIPNTITRKHKMMFYADSKPWLWMFANFFDALRTGSGDTHGRTPQRALSRENWDRMRDIIATWPTLSEQSRQALLKVIDTEMNLQRRMQCVQSLCPDRATYQQLQNALILGVLTQPSTLSSENWTLLREQIVASDITNKEAILKIIDTTPIIHGRENSLRTLDAGETYNQILERFFPELLVASRSIQPENSGEGIVSLREENWRRLTEMVVVSDMPHRDQVLALFDQEPDIAVRAQKLRSMNDGETYLYTKEVFFSELLYGLSPAAQENWEQLSCMVGRSNLAHKNEILEIIRTTAPGMERENAIRALDNGQSWNRMSEMLLLKLLSEPESVPLNGSGMSFSYELSPAAKQRAALLAQQQLKQAEMQVQAPVDSQIAVTKSATEFVSAKSFVPRIALKTDFLLWGGVMPGFDMGSWTPNLSAEVYFARRWSVLGGFAYSNWNALSGSKELYAVSVGDLELRYWFGKPASFRGFYVGLYGQFGEYDVQAAPVAQTGSFWCAGVGAGWLQPLSRNWAIEAQIRGGYRLADNYVYDIELDDVRKEHSSSVESKFVPSLRLNLIYRIGKSSEK